MIREETLVSDLKKKLNTMSLEKDRLSSHVHSEGVELLRHRAEAEKQTQGKLEEELKGLMREIFDLKDLISQGQKIKQNKINELKSLVSNY